MTVKKASKESSLTTSVTGAATVNLDNPMSMHGVEPYEEKAGEEYMNSQQKAHFKVILNLWQKALLEGGDATIEDLQNASNENPADVSDQASMEEEFAFKLRKRDRERKLISKIESSLQLLQNDEYGFCEECGVEIGIKRLEARPTATLCIDCKTVAEIREKQQQR